MSDPDEDAALALAIAHSLDTDAVEQYHGTPQARYDRQAATQAQIERDEDEDDDDNDPQLALQLEHSLTQAHRDAQLLQDAELASDLAVVDTLRESETIETARIALDAVADSYKRYEERQGGSWDCPLCTFRNNPYRSHCDACGTKAPVHILTFANVPEKMRFGVELELIIPNGMRDGFSCEWIATQLTALGIPTIFEGYTHRVVDTWKVVSDSSLRSSQDDLCFELVSPVLVGEDQMFFLRSLLDSIRKIGIKINATCGFHVHVDASVGEEQGVPAMGTLDGLQRVVQCFVALENAFDCLVARDGSQQAQQRRGNRHRYCQSNAMAFGALSNKKRWNRISSTRSRSDLVELVNPGSDRYRKLNFTNLNKPDRPDTIEFRQHGGVSELLAAEAWVRLVLRFCANAAKNQNAAVLQCLLQQEATAVD
eukprot:scaffold43533_cov153-Amphora_coffeaeformis.AAC.1